jgi:hypothetical protein
MRDRDVNRDYPRVCRPSDHHKRLLDRAEEIVAGPFQILYQKKTRFVAAALIWNLT